MSNTFKLLNPTGRKTEARILTTPDADLFFSYQTCIAYRVWDGESMESLRRPNDWGPTTGRHFNELGCANFECASSGDAFEAKLAEWNRKGHTV